MSSRCHVLTAVLCVTALVQLTRPENLSAQARRNQPRNAPTVDVSGDLEAMAPGMLRIKSSGGDPLLLQMSRTTKVHITGTAKKDVLGPNTFISFFAEVDMQESRVDQKVNRLTIFTPSPERPLGAFPDQSPSSEDPDAVEADAPAETPVPAETPAPKRRTRGKKDAGPTKGRFEIIGRITSVDKSGNVTVYAKNPYFRPAVQFQIAEEPEIKLDLTDPKMCVIAKPGDKVKARGRQLAPNVVQIIDLSIT
ncbi:MAG: hypothetical protein HQ582_24070, partial [Planctomycetes bacterium]|nr:hypothetical protein [Planctomycetota bacterium]